MNRPENPSASQGPTDLAWTVDYGQGLQTCTIPQCWRGEISVEWEGPAVYRTSFIVPAGKKLRFWGVSYEARVFVNDEFRQTHHGLWDAFDLDLSHLAGGVVDLRVEVIKNGGESFPVRDVLSGFYPFVFQTWGGIFRPVEWVSLEDDLEPAAPDSRWSIDRGLRKDGEPWTMKGVLTWGWHPELSSPHFPTDNIHKELDLVQSLGFNTVKFCLWLPDHEWLEEMSDRGLAAWIELPLWDPNPLTIEAMQEEILRIVRQYRHHDCIAAWTLGCELTGSTSVDFKESMVQEICDLTGCPLVMDNSGSSEMYGGVDGRTSTFRDFHPYCDLPFYPLVLDSLQNGPRSPMPILLGEFNDYDFLRDLDRLCQESPDWVSADPVKNAQGVRWQYDLPGIANGWVTPERFDEIRQSSLSQGAFMRRFIQEAVAARPDFSGWVITGWRDTPISSAGFIDDWDQPRFRREELTWLQEGQAFLVPRRSPPWVRGGNRPAWEGPFVFWSSCLTPVEVHGSAPMELFWDGDSLGSGPEVRLSEFEPGVHQLRAVSARSEWTWEIESIQEPDWNSIPFTIDCPVSPVGSGPILVTADRETFERHDGPGLLVRDALPMPFWREAAYDMVGVEGWRENWRRLISISGDSAMPLAPEAEIQWRRIDTRTLAVHSVLQGTHGRFETTLKPWGGLGIQPYGLKRNPAGWKFLTDLFGV